MSIFYCRGCDRVRDADDGCEELGGNLICHDCYDTLMDEQLEIEALSSRNAGAWDGLPMNIAEGEV